MNNKLNIPEYSVSEFNKSFQDIIESHFNYVRVKGEISEVRPATKGQVYLTIKDDNSILSGVIWESKKKSNNPNFEEKNYIFFVLSSYSQTRFQTSYKMFN